MSLCFALAVSWGTFPRYNLNFVFYFFSFYSIFFFFVRFLILFPFPITLNFSSNLCFCFFGIRLFFFSSSFFRFPAIWPKKQAKGLHSFLLLNSFPFSVSSFMYVGWFRVVWEMGFVSTLLGIIGFGIGIPLGLVMGFFFFIYSKPDEVKV